MEKEQDVKVTELKMEDVFDMDFLQEFQDDFAKSLGMTSVTVDIEGNMVTKPSYFTDFCMKYTRNSQLAVNDAWNVIVKAGRYQLKLVSRQFMNVMLV